MACAANPTFREVELQTRTTLKLVTRARYATRIAGPHLNSNFDRDFHPKISMLEKSLREAIAQLNSGVLDKLSADEAAEFARTIRLVRRRIKEQILYGCQALDLYRNPQYSAILADTEHNCDHLLAIAEGIDLTASSDFAQVVQDAVMELKERDSVGPMQD
jgi:hypothetical protein